MAGRAVFLFPEARILPDIGCPPSILNLLIAEMCSLFGNCAGENNNYCVF